MAPHRRNIGASRRRRRDDEGEEEGSDGGLDDDSLSEGSDMSHQDDDADAETSDGSEDDEASTATPQGDQANGIQVNGSGTQSGQRSERRNATSPGEQGNNPTVSDTEAMLNGLQLSGDSSQVAEVHFDNTKEEQPGQQEGGTSSGPLTDPKRETFAEKKRRENERYVKERDKNPAFVPTRGSFFLHDKRSTEPGTNGSRPPNKSKSRPYGLIVDGNVQRSQPKSDASEGLWTHDLHDTVAGDDPPASKPTSTAPNATSVPANYPVPTAPRSSPPNRSFSSTVLIGNVPVVVFLPGMARPTQARPVPKKQHTRLPQHRPPLRRDKPVRISLPGQNPRYIFPSTERSFIFIPRALRPNQQAFRGRGRGGFFGGRRSSIYANSAYSPSVALSRRSSLGRAPEGYHSPAASILSRATMVTTDNGKPAVRLPPPRPPGGFPQTTSVPGAIPPTVPPSMPPQPQHHIYRESHSDPIPMHQPRPQKTVSVADIETPETYTFNPPQPQQEQPFHHQVPMPVNGAAYPPDAPPPTHTPFSHIPERAIHAQPFQPYDYSQPQAFYPPGYGPQGVYYPVPGAEYPPYSTAMGPGASTAPYPPPGQQVPYMMPAPPTSTTEQPSSQSQTVAHEADGMVYYYDAAQMYSNPNPYAVPAPPGPGGVVGMGGMMTPPGTAYYYPQPPVYYPSQ